MSRDKYLAKKSFVSGFSFANLGAFAGFGNGIIATVYSLVLMDIFNNSATIGIYIAIYSVFCMFVSLFAEEFFRSFSKSRLFYISMISIAVMYFMMAYPIQKETFIALDFASGIPLTLVSLLIPLFMSDFSKGVGMVKLNGRYQFWGNFGALFAPMIAMFVAGLYGNRSAFFIVAFIYIMGAFLFNYFGIIQKDKKPKTLKAKRTIKLLVQNTVSYFKKPELSRAYWVNFGALFQSSVRGIYVPIIIIEQGFSTETLGFILMLGVIPHVLLATPISNLAQKYGTRIFMILGFVSFAIFSVAAAFTSGNLLLAIFVLWQISAAMISSIRDLLFYSAASKVEQSKYIGVFKTNVNASSIIAPLICAGVITVFGSTSVVWIVTALVSVFSIWVLPKKIK